MTIEIDGGEQSGSGTIVRTSVALAALSGRPLHLTRARARREKPGLRAQHLAAVRACAELCRGQTKGLGIGATEFTFLPGSTIRGGSYEWDIGTAGSATMLALGVLPVVCFAEAPVVARITGGVFQDFAPSPHHLQHVLAPLLARMGGSFALKILRAGYVPGGAGIIEIEVEPIRGGLRALELHDPGVPGEVAGVAFASHLAERRVAQRMARVCEQRLVAAGLTARIARVEDSGAAQAGASLAAWTESSPGCLFGADRAGARRRSSEAIGRFVARRLLQDLESGATTDRHVADQLVPFCALASGTTRYRAPLATEHLVTNLWLAERFGARTRLDGQAVEIEGLGLGR